MATRISALSLLLLLALPALGQDPTDLAPIHHDLVVRLDPVRHGIEVQDTLTLSPAFVRAHDGRPHFELHAGVTVESRDSFFVLTLLDQDLEDGRAGINHAATGSGLRRHSYELRARDGEWPADAQPRLLYSGQIHHPLVSEGQEYAGSFSQTPGIVDERGAVLSGSSWWLPSFGDDLVSFRLTVSVPATWDVVSQGQRTKHVVSGGQREVTWDCPWPMDEVYLIAAPFTEYSRPAGQTTAFAFLRTPDPNLAARYLEATAQYLEMYRKLIGPYPYGKFALIENFWETGYGMPSFTLLGQKIIRFPFILHSSYPHEILHNWWGNSVFVDYDSGNWCEGLTAYLADHLIKEGQGKGAVYRRDSLERYRNHVRDGRDFPLTEFRSRHSAATQAVGYGKALMLFHMLRKQIGDESFARGLQAFYREFKFKRAGFGDIEAVFSETTGTDFGPFFEQWTTRAGAPELQLSEIGFDTSSSGPTTYTIELRQVQQDDLYDLRVPVAIHIEGEDEPQRMTVELRERSAVTRVTLPGRPLLVEVDPGFDLFRRLDRSEIPPTIGQLFGAPRVLLVLPVDDPLGAAWETVAEAWSGGDESDVRVVAEDEIDALPQDRAVWVLGTGNRWAAQVTGAIERFGAGLGERWIEYGPTRIDRDGHCFAFVGSHPRDPDSAVGWLGADLAAALPGLARKLPHYGKYSYLGFSGDEPTNVAKGTWPAFGSPLVARLDADYNPSSALPASEPLAMLAPVFSADRLMESVRHLAADELEGRGVGTAGIDAAADWIAQAFAESGLQPGGDNGTFFHDWNEPGGPDGRPVRLRNIIGTLPGSNAEWDSQSVVLGAHYDHLGRGWPDVRSGNAGQIHNGADDNASGVAVMLEVARLLSQELVPQRGVVFVAFSGEEWGLKGSREYVRSQLRYPIGDAFAMVNLDTVGRLGDKKLTVFGSGSATEWIHIAMGIGFTTGVESNCIPDDLGASDQRSFLEAGVPAVQIFSGANEDYHRPSDDVDRIDASGLVKVATFVREAVVYLSERDRPLTSTLGGQESRSEQAEPPRSARRASLGTMPDFAFAGPGVRVAKVMPDSPAQAAGIADGDVIVEIDGAAVPDLRGYSDVLKSHAPGDQIRLVLQRGTERVEVRATLAER